MPQSDRTPAERQSDVLVKLLARSSGAAFDLDRKVLMVANLTIE